ncbi:unnamed protein product [Spirodela intermedia]|uniref:Uncharacterized protein n=1 Tax=Spirodela intermedia TaxID=51605 RepID=A0A7I8IQ00_SPIIN|nr:unnamed protein product [Spirodela intermedia]CAA6659654.1 unnamed protein product [Spirodela intermedia]
MVAAAGPGRHRGCPLVVAEHRRGRSPLRAQVFHSPPFTLSPGSVENKYYRDIAFPRGHIALKDLNAEVVDEAGKPVPLYETYMHHWLLVRYYQRKRGGDTSAPPEPLDHSRRELRHLRGALPQTFGLGSETRRTANWIPDPYGIEVGNPAEVPAGYEEKWMLNVHAIDTRGAVDRLGCTECRCELYNMTVDGSGRSLVKDYVGGLICCPDMARCRTGVGSGGAPRKLFLRYEVKWLDWAAGIVPAKVYILDVTDDRKRGSNSSTDDSTSCQVVQRRALRPRDPRAGGACIDSKRADLVLPRGGDIVYAVAHQHRGGVGAALYGQDGRTLCSSTPIYGRGKEAGDEAGYIVGMTTCYPSPGSVKVTAGERVTLISNYNATELHTGVMVLPTTAIVVYPNPVSWSNYSWVLLAITVASAVAVHCRGSRARVNATGPG